MLRPTESLEALADKNIGYACFGERERKIEVERAQDRVREREKYRS